jgi:hypothetical protein
MSGVKRGPKTGPSLVDRAKTGSKHHVITEGGGIPTAALVTGGNRNDITQLLPLIKAIPPVRGRRGRPRSRPDELYADRAYDSDKHRDQLRDKNITPHIARRGEEHGSGLGVHRWVVEQTMCAARRPVVSPVEPGGTWREVPGSSGLPEAERLGDKSMPENLAAGSSGQGRRVGWTRVIRRKLDCLKPNLQSMQVPIHRKDC